MSLPLRTALVSSIAVLAAAPALADYGPIEAGNVTLAVETVAEGLEHPWGMAFISDERFLVTERNPGTIRAGTVDGALSEPVWEADDLFRFEGETQRSQSGLFDIVLHPGFDENGWAYVSYSRATDNGSAVVIVRARVADEDGEVSLQDVEDVWVMKEEDQDSSGLHFGGRMAFGADGMLYLTIGDRRNLERAQTVSDQAGAVLRMTDEGEVPEDNPSFEADDDGSAADPYLFATGSRNIQALTVHPTTGELWAAEHGPGGGDQIHLIVGGNNYGWPYLTGGVDYSGAPLGVGTEMAGMTSATHIFDETVAPSGLAFVPEGTAFAEWSGDMLIGGLVTEGVVRVRLEDGLVADEEVIEIGRRIRDVEIGPDGALWVLTEHADGEVLRLSPQE